MTPELQQRLDSKLPPFDGMCIRNVDDLGLSQLREILAATANVLASSDSAIRSFHDWHEHDGYVVESKPDSWDAISLATATDRTLFDSRDDDVAVRIAYYPNTFDWLLRYNIDQEDGSDYRRAACDYDLSIAKSIHESELIEHLLTRFSNVLTQCESQPWFKSNMP